MHSVCKKLNNDLVAFRLDSSSHRMEKYDALLENVAKYFGVGEDDDLKTGVDKRLGETQFDAWFGTVMARPFNPEEIQESLEVSKIRVKDNSELPRHPESRIDERYDVMKAEATVPVRNWERVFNTQLAEKVS